MKRHSHTIRLALFCLALQFSALGHAQWLERTLQDFPYTKISHTIAVEDGYIFAISHGDFYAHGLYLYRLDWQGNVLWAQPVPVQGDMLLDRAISRQLIALQGGEFLMAIDLWDWDQPAGCAIIHYDSEGEELARWVSPEIWDQVLAILPLQDSAPWPMLMIMEGQQLWRVNSPQAAPVVLDQIQPSMPPLMLRDTLGRVLIGVQGGISVLNPINGNLSGPLILALQPPLAAHADNDGILAVLWQDRVQAFDLMGGLLWQHVVEGAKFSRLNRLEDRLYVLGNMYGYKDALLVLDMPTQTETAFLPPFTGIVKMQGVLPGEAQDLIWGRERHNAFIKSIGPDGQTQPLVSDAAISDFQYGDVLLTTSYGPGQVPITYNIRVKTPTIEVSNEGPDTLRSVIVNYAVDVTLFGFPAGIDGFPRRMVRLDSLDLAPGESETFELSDFLFRVDAYLSGPVQKGSFCVELSCPNDRIDAAPADNKFCVTVEDFITSVEQPEFTTEVRVFPNPFSGQLHVDGIPEYVQRCRLIDPLGRVVAAWQMDGAASFTLQTPDQLSGLYTLLLEDAEGQIRWTGRVLRTR